METQQLTEFVSARLDGQPAIPEFVVMRRQAKMPGSMKFGNGQYVKIAVIQTNGVDMPKQIHPNHKSVVAIKYLRDKLYWGKTGKSAGQLAYAYACQLASELNASSALNH